MKPRTRYLMNSLRRARETYLAQHGADPAGRAKRAAHLRACRAIRGGRESLRQTYLYGFRR